MLRKFGKKTIRNLLEKRKNVFEYLPETCRVTFVDVGAAGELLPRWKQIASRIDYIGFEPHTESRKVLESSDSDFASRVIFEYGADLESGTRELHLTREPEKSSFLKPNMEILSRFPNSKRFEIVDRVLIETRAIDDLLNVEVDFMKLDVQGNELRTLEGAQNVLTNCFGVEVEVEFTPLYSDQPLFGEVCTFLESNGFVFIDFTNLCRWERDNLIGFGQCVFGDALFLRTPERVNLDNLSDNRLLSYLTILALYKRVDLISDVYTQLKVRRENILSEFEEFFLRIEKNFKRTKRNFRFISRLSKINNPDDRIHHIY